MSNYIVCWLDMISLFADLGICWFAHQLILLISWFLFYFVIIVSTKRILSSILSKLLYLLNMKFELYTPIKSYRYYQNFSDAPYYVSGISTYKDIWVCVCVCVSVHLTWIDLDKWIFVKTFQVSILASLSLIVVSI